MLYALGGGCLVPVGASTQVDGAVLTLRGAVLAPDGSRRVVGEIAGAITAAEALGRQLAADLLQRGARELLQMQETRQ
jgi:hydroxymethylbilane synthase